MRDGGISLFKNQERPIDFTPNPFDSVNDLIAPFWCDIAPGGTTTNITYGTTTSLIQLLRADAVVNVGFRGKGFISDKLFIATWTNALATGGDPAQVSVLYGCTQVLFRLCR